MSQGQAFLNANTNELVNAHVGPALLFIAPFGTTFPTGVDSVINLTGSVSTQYKPKTGWSCLGATKTGIKPERGFTKMDRSSDQSNGPFDSKINGWQNTIMTELMETTPTALQIAWEGGAIATDASPVTTTLAAAAAIGAVSALLNSVASIVSGDVLSIGKNIYQEWHMVTLVSGTTVFFQAGEAMLYAQVSGEYVVRPGKKSYGFGHPRSSTPRLVSVIAPMNEESTTAQGTVHMYRMWAYRVCRLAEGQRAMNLGPDNDWTLPIGFHAYRDPTIVDGSKDTFMVFDLTI